ncbi:Clp protease N-terminal domain-containing protein [Leptothoe sp. EHU-05/26/07-4]
MKRVLELARETVNVLGQTYVAPEHLLVGMLEETEEVELAGHLAGLAARMLREKFGINLDRLMQQLKAS